MKADIQDLKDSFRIGYEAFEESRKEANEVWDLYHNRQYTVEQLNVLAQRGQPAETFNIVKLFARMLVGYYSTVVNTVVVSADNVKDTDTATLLNDAITSTFRSNRFDIEGDKIKLGGMISGLLCCYTDVIDTLKRDRFNRPINKVVSHHVKDSSLVLDPSSEQDDYSDAEWLHHFKWMTKNKLNNTFGKGTSEKLDAYYNFLNIDEAEFSFNYGWEYTGYFRVFDNYLVVHSVMVDEDGKRWSIFWSGDEILKKTEITYKETKWPYRVQKLHSSDKTEYYGIFRDVVESQKAINQALIKLQLMINSEKVYVEEGAVEDIEIFRQAVNRVNGVIEVESLSKIKVEEMSREVLDQYIIIDKSFDRIQRILGINDSFLGMAFASDSGRKVKLQKDATIMSLRYMTARIESFYRSLGWDTANLIKQFYTANQVLRVSDEASGNRWIEINKPMMQPTGQLDEEGQPVMEPILLPMEDPASGEFIQDPDGNIVLAPVAEEQSEFMFTEFEVDIESTSYNDEDEKAQLMLETVMSGNIGTMLSQVNPSAFFKMAALSIKSMKTKYSPNISALLEQTSQSLAENPEAQQGASEMAQGGSSGGSQPLSKGFKLPQNTNEGVG
jgi:hypothetical protein